MRGSHRFCASTPQSRICLSYCVASALERAAPGASSLARFAAGSIVPFREKKRETLKLFEKNLKVKSFPCFKVLERSVSFGYERVSRLTSSAMCAATDKDVDLSCDTSQHVDLGQTTTT
jgi:hypothetical protein